MNKNPRKTLVLLAMMLFLLVFIPASLAAIDPGPDCIDAVLTAVEENDAEALAMLFVPAWIDEEDESASAKSFRAAALSAEEIEAGLASLRSIWKEQPYSISAPTMDGSIIGMDLNIATCNYWIETEEGRYQASLEYVTDEGPPRLLWFCLTAESGTYGSIAPAAIQPAFQYRRYLPLEAVAGTVTLLFAIWCLVHCCKRKPPHWKGWAACILFLHVAFLVSIDYDGIDWVFIPAPLITVHMTQIVDGFQFRTNAMLAIPLGALIYCYKQWRRRVGKHQEVSFANSEQGEK